jgi:prepilin-type processing-associated H-X9-DG protein
VNRRKQRKQRRELKRLFSFSAASAASCSLIEISARHNGGGNLLFADGRL